MLKFFSRKKKSKKDKESKKDQNKENIENIATAKTNNNESSSSSSSSKLIIESVKIDGEKKIKKDEEGELLQQLSIDTSSNVQNNNQILNSCQASPSVLTDSHNESSTYHPTISQQHHQSFKTSDFNATFSGADLNRILTSGYITGDEDMGYLKRGVDLKSPKSPHFHRPPNFSYSHQPSITNQSLNRRTNQGLLTSTLSSISTVKKVRNYSTSPTRSIESEEAIKLSKLPGGYIPDPEVPKKIESLDWPSPPFAPAMPELKSRSRSTSNRRSNNVNDEIDHSTNLYKQNVRGIIKANIEDVKTSTKVYRKIYDNQHDDYTLRFKRNKNEEEEVEEESGEQVIVNEKIKRDLEEISKLENKSGIAKIIAKELKTQEKVVIRDLNPWKASRTPSANIEPSQKTRFESPVNASPSRFICSYKTSYEDVLCSTSAISTSTIQNNKDGTNLCSTPRKGNSLQKSSVPKPGYGLTSPKATTLPNSSRYTGMTTHKSVDFDSLGIQNESKQNESTGNSKKLTGINAYINSRNAHATRSTPNLIGTPKIYKYDELKVGYKKKLPSDVDRERLERHLDAHELLQLFGVSTLEEFYELPEWRRVELKKKSKLF